MKMKRIISGLFVAAFLLALPETIHADEFSQIQNSPNTYWVPAPATMAYYPPPGYAAGPPPGYYGPPPAYYGPPPPPPPRVYIGVPGLFIGFHFH